MIPLRPWELSDFDSNFLKKLHRQFSIASTVEDATLTDTAAIEFFLFGYQGLH